MSEIMDIKKTEVIKEEKFTSFDPANYLESEEDFIHFMAEAFKTEDVSYIAHALGVVARAKGMTQIAKETGLGRESLYKTLSGEGNPGFGTILKVMRALNIKLHPQPLFAKP